MIKRLRNRFIRIATLSVAAVMLLLTVILNAANYISTDADQRQTLTLIAENRGTIPITQPDMPDGTQEPPDMPDGITPQPDQSDPGRRGGPGGAAAG